MTLSILICERRWAEVLKRIDLHPNEVRSWGDGWLPIHRACSRANVPVEVIEALTKAYPQSLQLKSNQSNRIPLHYAVSVCQPSTDVVKVLLQHYKEGASVLYTDRFTPLSLHLFTSSQPSLDVVKMLVDAHPDLVHTRGVHSEYPLHYAACRGNWKIARYLIESYPNALLGKTKDGKTPQVFASLCGNHRLNEKLCEETEKRFGSNCIVSRSFLEENGEGEISSIQVESPQYDCIGDHPAEPGPFEIKHSISHDIVENDRKDCFFDSHFVSGKSCGKRSASALTLSPRIDNLKKAARSVTVE